MYFDTCHEKPCFADDIRINDDDDEVSYMQGNKVERARPPVRVDRFVFLRLFLILRTYYFHP